MGLCNQPEGALVMEAGPGRPLTLTPIAAAPKLGPELETGLVAATRGPGAASARLCQGPCSGGPKGRSESRPLVKGAAWNPASGSCVPRRVTASRLYDSAMATQIRLVTPLACASQAACACQSDKTAPQKHLPMIHSN